MSDTPVDAQGGPLNLDGKVLVCSTRVTACRAVSVTDDGVDQEMVALLGLTGHPIVLTGIPVATVHVGGEYLLSVDKMRELAAELTAAANHLTGASHVPPG